MGARVGQIKAEARRLTDEQVANLRAAREAGATYKQLGLAFGLSTVSAYNVARGITYAETHPEPYEDGRAGRRISGHRQNQRVRRLKFANSNSREPVPQPRSATPASTGTLSPQSVEAGPLSEPKEGR